MVKVIGGNMSNLKQAIYDEIKEVDLFKNIKEETLNMICNCAIERRYEKGQVIFRDKENIKVIYIVLDGKFSLYKIGEDAQKRVIFILGRGKVLNEVILDELPASINCEAFENGKLLIIDRNKLLSIMEQDFVLTKSVINSLSIKVRRLYRQLKNTTLNKKTEKKIAAELWKLSMDYGVETQNGILIDMNLSMTYLADMLGSQRETISRCIRELENKGLIYVEKKRITVRNRENLSNFFKGL